MQSNPNSLFHEASQFILPETSLYDFFDYLAGQKLDIAEEKPLSEQIKITFKHIDLVPKQLYLNRKFDSSDEKFKPIFLRQVKDQLKEDRYPRASDDSQQDSGVLGQQERKKHELSQIREKSIKRINKPILSNRKKPLVNTSFTQRNNLSVQKPSNS